MGDRELEQYYEDIRRGWMADLTENITRFDPAWADPQGYPTPNKLFVTLHAPAPTGLRYRIADLNDPNDVGPTIPHLDPNEEGNVALSKRMTWLLRHGAVEKGLPMDTGGWSDINYVARICRTRVEVLIGIARVSDKGRFQVAIMETLRTGQRQAYPSSDVSRGTPWSTSMRGG